MKGFSLLLYFSFLINQDYMCYDIVTSRKVPFVLDLAGLPDHACCEELLNKSCIYTSNIF